MITPISRGIKQALNIHKPIEFAEKKQIITGFYTGEIATLENIQKAERIIKSWEDSLGEDPFPLFHTIADGMYSREMHVPRGYLIVGKMHRYEHLVRVDKGRIWVADETGIKEVTAHQTFVSKPGIKRIGIVLEDLVWTDIHKTDKMTLEEIEHDIFVEEHHGRNRHRELCFKSA